MPTFQAKPRGGLNIGLLTDALLQGRKASEAIEYAMSTQEKQQVVNSIPRLPKFAAEAKAGKYGGTVQDSVTLVRRTRDDREGAPDREAADREALRVGAASPRGGLRLLGADRVRLRGGGIKTPGRLTTGPMAKMGKGVAWKNIQPGDWIVRHSGGRGHVVMYVGNGQVIAAPQTGEVVQYQPLSRFASDTRYSVRRWHG